MALGVAEPCSPPEPEPEPLTLTATGDMLRVVSFVDMRFYVGIPELLEKKDEGCACGVSLAEGSGQGGPARWGRRSYANPCLILRRPSFSILFVVVVAVVGVEQRRASNPHPAARFALSGQRG